MIDVIVSKCCTVCRVVRAVQMFRVDLCTRDGHKSQCKYCLNERDRARHRRHREAGKVRSRTAAQKVEPLWPLPTHTIQESLANVAFRKAMRAIPAQARAFL